MSRKDDVHLSADYINKLSYDRYITEQYTETKKKKSLSYIMNKKLNERQRNCIIWYYIEKKRMDCIAKRLNVSIATVSRTIERAKKIIWEEYYGEK